MVEVRPIFLSSAVEGSAEPGRIDTPTARAAVRDWTGWDRGVQTVLQQDGTAVVAIASYLAEPLKKPNENPLSLKIKVTA